MSLPDDRLSDISALHVTDLMSTGLLTAYEGWSIKRLAAFFVRHQISGAPVVASDDSLVGVVTKADIIQFETKTPSDAEARKMVQFYYGPNVQGFNSADIRRLKEKAIETCTVNSIMTPHIHSCDINTSVASACHLMVKEDVHRLFVTDNGRVVGVVTAMDFLRRMVAT